MSVSVSRSDGVTVMTLTSDPSSLCPPLCQLLGALCYSPGLCSYRSRLSPHHPGAQTVLGALWIITALLHIGLGLVLINTRGAQVYRMQDTYFPVWLPLLFLLLGVCSLLTEKHPRPLFILLSGILNLGGLALSILAIMWNSEDIDRPGFASYCNRNYQPPAPATLPYLERCEEARYILWSLVICVRSVLLTLSVLNLSLSLSSAIISFKTLDLGTRGSKPLQKEAKDLK